MDEKPVEALETKNHIRKFDLSDEILKSLETSVHITNSSDVIRQSYNGAANMAEKNHSV